MVILSGHMRRAEAVHKDLQPKVGGFQREAQRFKQT